MVEFANQLAFPVISQQSKSSDGRSRAPLAQSREQASPAILLQPLRNKIIQTRHRMRATNKSRARNKGNRRSPGNVLNRVFDSSGPEGKVRGNPQQIIEKYQALARDAALIGDRVAAENFAQHSEHYTRILGEAQRELEARREQQEAQAAARRAEAESRASAAGNPAAGTSPGAETRMNSLAVNDSRDSGLVDTPEGKNSGGKGSGDARSARGREQQSDLAAGQPGAK